MPTTGKRIGILGGGQLGRMLVEAASPLHLDVHAMDSSTTVPVCYSLPTDRFHSGNFKNPQDIQRFVDEHKIEILTVEIEHVDAQALRNLSSVEVHPHPDTIALIQDKFLQKKHLKDCCPVAPFREVFSVAEIEGCAGEFGYPMMLKSKRLAYDGRGNAVIRSRDEIEQAVKSLCGAAYSDDLSQGKLYLEKWVTFEKELAVMVVRSRDGQLDAYPVVETIQKNNICHVVIAPAQIDVKAQELASRIALDAVRTLSGAGVFGVEMFLDANGNVYMNEIAPRPHNSGHYTIEACYVSQFEQHLRAIAGMPLGSCEMKVSASIMLNILGTGDEPETMLPIKNALSVHGASVHWYGKSECKLGRKMGHITLVGTSMNSLLQHLKSISPESVPAGTSTHPKPLVGIIMGSDSDLPVMRPCAEILKSFNIPFELTIVSAHRTPDRLMTYARTARSRGLQCIVAGAGGAAHLPGMVASMTALPVIGVPVRLKHLDGVDSLYSIVQMPRGVPVACVAIDNSTNAGLLAVRILGAGNPELLEKMEKYQETMTETVMEKVDKLEKVGWASYSP